MPHRLGFATIASVLLLSQTTAAQVRPVTVRGVVFDSLRGEPLIGAHVVMLGVGRSSTTDARGRFRFDTVPAGPHTFVVQHAALDSIGLSGLSKRATILDGSEEVRLAVPSFASLWRLACGSDLPPSDSGFVYGTIREAVGGMPVAGAYVDLTWVDLSYDRKQGGTQHFVRGAARSDSTGSYSVCGVPAQHWLRMDAGVASGASGRIDLPPTDRRVQRRDLLIGWSATVDSTRLGTITGLLTDMDGAPFADARVVVDDTAEVRSGADGRFTLGGVPIGTRQVEVLSIGMVPVVTAVNVFPRDTARVALQLRKVTMLDVVRVTGSRTGRMVVAALEERKRAGFGYTLEIGQIARHVTMSTVFAEFPGVSIRQRSGDFVVYVQDGRGGECAPHVYIDGAKMDYAALNMLRPGDAVAVELFARAQSVPTEFRRSELRMTCGVILVWTIRSFQ